MLLEGDEVYLFLFAELFLEAVEEVVELLGVCGVS